jgi:hypothetical protein
VRIVRANPIRKETVPIADWIFRINLNRVSELSATMEGISVTERMIRMNRAIARMSLFLRMNTS